MKFLKTLNKLNEEVRKEFQYEEVDFDTFEEALSKLATLDLDDSQIRNGQIDPDDLSFLFGGKYYGGSYWLYILNYDDLPSSGSFQIAIKGDDDEEIIGTIRGNKFGNIVSFRFIHINEENRGNGIGTDIYRKFLDSNFIIKSDKEITDSTYSIYYNLARSGDYKPLIFADGRVGLKK